MENQPKLKNGLFERGQPLNVTDKNGIELHSGDLVVAIHGSIRAYSITFGIYKLIGTRKVKDERRVLTSDLRLKEQVALKKEWCIFLKSYKDVEVV